MVSFPLTGVATCHISCLFVAHCVGAASFWVSHFCLLRWLCVVLDAQLPFTNVTLSCLRCSTATQCDVCFTSGVPLLHMKWLLVVSVYALTLTWVAVCHSWCPKASSSCVSALSLVYHCCSLRYFQVVPGFTLQFTSLVFCYISYCTSAHGVACSLMQFCVFSGVLLSLFGWLCVILNKPLPIIKVALHCPRCLIATHWGITGVQLPLLWWFSVFLGVLPLLSVVVQCCSRGFTSAPMGGYDCPRCPTANH